MKPGDNPLMPLRLPVSAIGCVLGCMAFSATADSTPPLGTLFYTPAQRQEIERLRKTGPDAAVASPSLSGAPSGSRLSGVVQRADGKGTVWVNARPIAQEKPGAPKIHGVDALVAGKRLRVGEALDPVTGQRTADLPPGAVQVGTRP